MGKIRSGILSRVSGKVAGVVGGNWKNVAYLREYVVPANPNTTAQAAQRSKFSACVAFAKPLVGPIFQAYTDKFQKNMSGYNAFIKSNISLFPAPTWTQIKITEGPLAGLGSFGASASGGIIRCAWDGAAVGSNGAPTDKIYGVVYNPTSGEFHFAPAPVLRSSELLEFTDVQAVDGMVVYAFAAQEANGILKFISTSNAAVYTE